MSRYFIEAADVLFFKDGREIAPGSEYSASSVFPPNPGTIYGALRSAILSNEEEVDFSDENFGHISKAAQNYVGTRTEKGELQIDAFQLAQNKVEQASPLFPLPLDVLVRKKPDHDEENEVLIGVQRNGKEVGIKSNLPVDTLQLSWFKHQEGAFFEHVPTYIDEQYFQAYLCGDIDSGEDSLHKHLLSRQKQEKPITYFEREPRIGIVINSETNTVEESQLFTTPFIRPNQHIGFIVDVNVNGELLPDKTKLRLGGDGKLAMLTKIEDRSDTGFEGKLKRLVLESDSLKMVLTTPAVFENGWVPDGIDDETGTGNINGVDITLTGASVGKHLQLGGWDVAHGHPKRTKRAVPPGSVYYFKTREPEKVIEHLHKKSICADDDNKKQGLGIIHIGVNK